MKPLAVIFVSSICLPAIPLHAEDMSVVRKMSDNKFTAVEGLPSCASQAVQSGDPSKGPAVILFKAKTGCVIPWHWHTPTEQIMVVSGAAKVQMKDGANSTTLGPGSYAKLPGKHVHQFTCTSNCTGFVTSDAAFDIHYVDAAGKEIPAEAALSPKH
ncbi:cupin domain-containing protein [Herbaspirillum sp. HC18]|nr:cupin domain-containing protein [Herbaspirillum sp. HC18]